MGTTFGPIAAPIISYSLIAIGVGILISVFLKAYKNFVIGQNTLEIVDIGRETIRRGSTLIINSSHKILPHKETSYQPLNQSNSSTPNGRQEENVQELNFMNKSNNLSTSIDELKSILNRDFVKANFSEMERESLIQSDNTFIMSEHRRSRIYKVTDSF